MMEITFFLFVKHLFVKHLFVKHLFVKHLFVKHSRSSSNTSQGHLFNQLDWNLSTFVLLKLSEAELLLLSR